MKFRILPYTPTFLCVMHFTVKWCPLTAPPCDLQSSNLRRMLWKNWFGSSLFTDAASSEGKDFRCVSPCHKKAGCPAVQSVFCLCDILDCSLSQPAATSFITITSHLLLSLLLCSPGYCTVGLWARTVTKF